MEYQKITNLLGTTLNEIPRFITKKRVSVHDQSGSADDRYRPITDPNNVNYNKNLAFRNNAPFTFCISKINNKLINDTEDQDIVIPIYKRVLQYKKSYRKTTASLWNYYRDKPNSGIGGRNNSVNYSIKDSKSFNYKRSITEQKMLKLLCH